jgi:DNA-binding beta-propeller fold protein YncE
MGRKNHKILILLFVALLGACVKDKPTSVGNTSTTGGNVYIVCEGNFGNGNATLYTYNTTTESLSGDVFKAANNASLGDVFQSMTRIGDSLYLCINNSDKIEVINAHTYKSAGTITISKPRYILPVNATLAYVSSLYSNKVYAINPQSLQLTGTIEIPANNPEGMCTWSGNIIICPWDTNSNKIYKTDAITGQVLQTITVAGYAPQAVLVDKEQMLWVLSGNVVKGKQAALTRIDPSTGAILKSFLFTDGADPIKPVFNPTKDTLYFIEVKYDGSSTGNGIYRMSIYDTNLPATPFITAQQYQYFWALGIDPATGNIYTGDPRGFIQKGSVSIHKPDGTLLKTFDVGLGPGQFYFNN